MVTYLTRLLIRWIRGVGHMAKGTKDKSTGSQVPEFPIFPLVGMLPYDSLWWGSFRKVSAGAEQRSASALYWATFSWGQGGRQEVRIPPS